MMLPTSLRANSGLGLKLMSVSSALNVLCRRLADRSPKHWILLLSSCGAEHA